jgi:hypothetical protein
MNHIASSCESHLATEEKYEFQFRTFRWMRNNTEMYTIAGDAPMEELGLKPTRTFHKLTDLVDVVKQSQPLSVDQSRNELLMLVVRAESGKTLLEFFFGEPTAVGHDAGSF